MKILLFLISTLVVMSCCTSKEATLNTANNPVDEVVQDNRIVGKVRINDTACLVYIEAFEDGKMVNMYPVNLEEKLKIDGIKIKFEYVPSRAMQPENCVVDKVVALNNVTELR